MPSIDTGTMRLISSLMTWIVVQSTYSVSLQMIQTQEECLMCQMIVLAFRGTVQAGEVDGQNPHRVQLRAMQKYCAAARITPGTSTPGLDQGKADLQNKS